MLNHEDIAEQLRDRAGENLNRDDLIRAIADQFIAEATDDHDPIDHPTSYRTATPDQQNAIDKILGAVQDYILAATIDPAAVEQYIQDAELVH